MYYLWKDKKSTDNNLIIYITDYEEIREDGKVKVDKYGFVEAELLASSEIKSKLYEYANKLAEE